MTSTLHSDLVPLLEKHGVTWGLFSRKGRLPKDQRWVGEKRRDIITELHLSGMSWTRMIEVTGLSLGAIERGTKATWNPASKKNRQENAARVGASRKGEKKPWLSERLKNEWGAGKFYALLENPHSKFGKCGGYGTWCEVEATKCSNRGSRFRVRSTYERQAVIKLESNSDVHSYEYEPPLVLPEGRRIYPDFLVTYEDQSVQLVEVKPVWVLTHPKVGNNYKQIARLMVAAEQARRVSWGFAVWTEKELGL
jgi:hypothetical protein